MKPEFKTNLVETYNHHARERDKREIKPWKIQELERFVDILKDKQKRTLLEIGAGTGQYSRLVQERGFDVVSTDGSPGMVKLCREKGLLALVMDFYNLGFPDEHFEAIWAQNCLLHVPKKELPDVLRGIKTILKPKGLIYLGLWGGIEFEGVWESDSYTPKRFFSFYPDQQVQEEVANFFEIVYFKPIFVAGMELHFQSMILRK
jgi:SAM-dependent methyltransferase